MNTPNIDLLLSDIITFRRGWLAKMLEVTVHDGDDTRFDAVSIVDLIHEIRALRQQRDEARKERDHYMIVGLQRLDRICAVEAQLAAARTVTDAMINKGWSLLHNSCIEEYGSLNMVEREDFADALIAALKQRDA